MIVNLDTRRLKTLDEVRAFIAGSKQSGPVHYDQPGGCLRVAGNHAPAIPLCHARQVGQGCA